MPVIYFQCTINTICNISLPTIMTTIYPKAAPYPPRIGWHFSNSSADCGKLTFRKLNSPSSCSSEKNWQPHQQAITQAWFINLLYGYDTKVRQ